MLIKVWTVSLLTLLFVAFITPCPYGGEPVAFTQEDRERLIRLEVIIEEFKESVDKRFEQFDKRFEQMMNFLLILAGIFTTLTLGVIGFACWDRRTVIKKARDEAIEKIEREWKLQDLILALREIAKTNADVERVMRSFHLL
ncbi:MAG: hypothetical protein JRF35_14000 [Deltaproteobacteria bacterium]|nr:hypothetical protein [Deltaproteobacteria bacterium]